MRESSVRAAAAQQRAAAHLPSARSMPLPGGFGDFRVFRVRASRPHTSPSARSTPLPGGFRGFRVWGYVFY